jgi:hypothetical protein
MHDVTFLAIRREKEKTAQIFEFFQDLLSCGQPEPEHLAFTT